STRSVAGSCTWRRPSRIWTGRSTRWPACCRCGCGWRLRASRSATARSGSRATARSGRRGRRSAATSSIAPIWSHRRAAAPRPRPRISWSTPRRGRRGPRGSARAGRWPATPISTWGPVRERPRRSWPIASPRAGGRLVGVTDYCDFPAEAKRKPRIGGIYTPNLEAILNLGPDLVLATSEGNREEHVRALEELHLPVFVVRPVDFASVLESITRVGEVLDRAVEARRLVADMQGRADAIARAVAGLRRPRVLYVLWGNPLIVP